MELWWQLYLYILIWSATMMENQFSFLLTLFLLSKFLKQVLIIFTMISWFDGASIINTCNNPLFQLGRNKRNWFRVTVISFHQQIKTDMTILNHRWYKFGQANFNDFSRTNYSFQSPRPIHKSALFTPFLNYGVIYHFYFFSHTTFRDKTLQRLGMTWSCIWGTEIAFEIRKQK